MSEHTPRNIFATLPRTTRGMPLVLGGDPKGKNFLYANGKSIVIRDINTPGVADIYSQHSYNTLVAKYSPSGYYIASGDASGRVRIWDTVNPEHILKYEYQPLSGPIKDLAWSPDSKRIIVGGEGRDKYCAVFLWDSGSSVGQVHGHAKSVNSVDYKQERPYRVITGSEDHTVGFSEGPPFKATTFHRHHINFVNVARFNPDGRIGASGGADGKIILLDGKTGEMTGQLVSEEERAHAGGVYGLSFNSDGSKLLSVSADKTAKIWDCSTSKLVTTFKMGSALDNQQLGCLWQNEHILTVSLSGYINYLDINNPDKPLRILKGHNKNIMSLAANRDGEKFYSGSFDGVVCEWNASSGEAEVFEGKGHTNEVSDMCVSDDHLVTVAMDDTVRFTPLPTHTYGSECVKLESQPRAVSCAKDIVVVACISEVVVLVDKKKALSLPVGYEPNAIAINPDASQVAVGGKNDFTVHIYSLLGDRTLNEVKTLPGDGEVTDIRYSPSGEHLAIADSQRKLAVHDVETWELTGAREGVCHSARLTSIDWSPDSSQVCVGSLDTGLSVWVPEDIKKKLHIKSAHMLNAVTRVIWLDNKTVVSAGLDCNLKIWDISY